MLMHTLTSVASMVLARQMRRLRQENIKSLTECHGQAQADFVPKAVLHEGDVCLPVQPVSFVAPWEKGLATHSPPHPGSDQSQSIFSLASRIGSGRDMQSKLVQSKTTRGRKEAGPLGCHLGNLPENRARKGGGGVN